MSWLAASLLGLGMPGASALAQDEKPPTDRTAEGAPTLARALQAAWHRSLDTIEAGSRRRQAQAEQAIADSWLAHAPGLDISRREGRSAAEAGSRETELGVTLPLWRLGLRQASQSAARAEGSVAEVSEQAARLRLAGELRVQAGAARAAQAELRLAELARELYAQLANDVQRRVRAGDLASADALAARAELLQAEERWHAGRLHQQEQLAHWQLLTGLMTVAEAESVLSTDAPDMEAHPRLRLAMIERERGRLRVEQVRARSTAAPELKLGVRQDQTAQDANARHSVVVGLRLPFGTDTWRQPELAAALAEHELAEAREQRLRRQLASDAELARAGLRTAASQESAARERAALLRQRAQLIQRSFQAGESPLRELLFALSAAAQAEATVVRQQAALELARSQLRQVQGILP